VVDVMSVFDHAPMFPVHIYERAGRWHKEPRIADWKWRATISPAQIASWRREFGDAFGIPLVRVGWVVLDADRHGDGPDGVAALAQLTADRDWPPHPIVATAGGGFHHVFAQPSPALGNKTGGLPGGIDVRGVGGWIVKPGTVRSDGAEWRLVEDGPVPMLPGWIEDIIRGKPTISQRAMASLPHRGISRLATPLGDRDKLADQNKLAARSNLPKPLYNKLIRLVNVLDRDQRRVRGILATALNWQTVSATGEVFCQRDGAHRNEGLHWATRQLRELGFVDRAVAVELLVEVTKANGYLAKDGEEVVLRTIESGWPELEMDGSANRVAR
jgi:Bifunctional DNA primase/polymerase, N-terminal